MPEIVEIAEKDAVDQSAVVDQSAASPLPTTHDFAKVVTELVQDLMTTFPELTNTVDPRIVAFLESMEAGIKESKAIDDVHDYCVAVFPERFFDILYQNQSMWEGDCDTKFLPGIDFRELWNDATISDSTKSTLWKYLQLILFSVIGSVKDGASFGDTASLFEAISESELRSKLEDTMQQMNGIFEGENGSTTEEGADWEHVSGDPSKPNIDPSNIPSADDLYGHISGMMDGKLGTLAQEIAEETATEFDIDINDTSDVKGVFKQLFKNPGKLMSLVKNVGTKLDTKLKSGDLSESELIKEAAEIMKKMKDMPGMDNIQDLMKKAGIGGGGEGMTEKNVNAQLNTKLRQAQMKERMLAKAEANRAKRELTRIENLATKDAQKPDLTPAEMDQLVFQMGEPMERSSKKDKPTATGDATKKKKKKKKNGGK
jgi:hypothetical protein